MCATKMETNTWSCVAETGGDQTAPLVSVSQQCGSSRSARFPLLVQCVCASVPLIVYGMLRFGMYSVACQQCGPLANHRLAHKDWSHGPHITCHLGPTGPSGDRRPRFCSRRPRWAKEVGFSFWRASRTTWRRDADLASIKVSTFYSYSAMPLPQLITRYLKVGFTLSKYKWSGLPRLIWKVSKYHISTPPSMYERLHLSALAPLSSSVRWRHP